MPHEFTTEEIRMLAQAEREMDEGKRPFVIHEGQRWSVLPEVMTGLGLKNGQTVNSVIIEAVVKAIIRICQREIKARKMPNE